MKLMFDNFLDKIKEIINNIKQKIKSKKQKKQKIYNITRYEDVYDNQNKKVAEATVQYSCLENGEIVIRQKAIGKNITQIGMIIDNRKNEIIKNN